MPVALDPRTGLVASVAYEDDIRQSILIILETAPGERVMRPNFGCGIHELVFTALDSTTLQRIRSDGRGGAAPLRGAHRRARRQRRRGRDARRASCSSKIEYRVRKTNQIGNLVFPFYFREGGRP